MPKLKSITELKDEKKQLSARSKDVIEKAKTEKRQLSAEENELLGANQLRMREIDLEIEERMDENTSPGRPHVTRQGGFYCHVLSETWLMDVNSMKRKPLLFMKRRNTIE